MSFADSPDWINLFPSYLSSPEKGRLIESLKQFKKGGVEIDYSNFYTSHKYDYFLQGDIIEDFRIPIWNSDSGNFTKSYTLGIILSNTCDLSRDNKRDLNKKQCLCAPIILLNEYLNNLEKSGLEAGKISGISKEIKSQNISNILFLPSQDNTSEGFIALLDQVFWFPTDELNNFFNPDENGVVDTGRLNVLSHFGYYLFILKLSYHLCRLPEEEDRIH